jgi:hypothetical protein
MTLRRILVLSALLATTGCAMWTRSGTDEPTPLNTPVAPTLFVTGSVTTTGAECPAVRGDDGKTYTIAAPSPMPLRNGLHVRAIGSQAQVSTCMQGTTIRATSIENLSGTIIDPASAVAPKAPSGATRR